LRIVVIRFELLMMVWLIIVWLMLVTREMYVTEGPML